MKTVVILCVSEAVRRAIHARLDGRVCVEECSSDAELIDRVRRTHAQVAIRELSSDVHARVAMRHALRMLVTSMPDVRLLAVCTLGRHTMTAARAAWSAGVRTVTLHPYDDIARATRRALNRTILDRAERRIMGLLPSWLSAYDCRTVGCCVRYAHRRPTVTGIAEQLNVSERTLERRCRDASLPSPEELISRCRILMALEVSRPRRRSLDRTSRVFGFCDAADLRTKLKRHTGLTVGQARLLQSSTDLLFLDTQSGQAC